MITIQGNGTIRTIAVTKHLGTNLKRPEVLLCFDCRNPSLGLTTKARAYEGVSQE
jgi:hypothetical protein